MVNNSYLNYSVGSYFFFCRTKHTHELRYVSFIFLNVSTSSNLDGIYRSLMMMEKINDHESGSDIGFCQLCDLSDGLIADA